MELVLSDDIDRKGGGAIFEKLEQRVDVRFFTILMCFFAAAIWNLYQLPSTSGAPKLLEVYLDV